MSDIHIVLQGKGGVGKSVVAAFITQQKKAAGNTVLAIDTDPVNATFSGYAGIGAQYINIMEGDEINPRRFDGLIEMIVNSEANCIVVDNGAASFVALASYLHSNDVVELLTDMKHTVYIHTVITGGQALKDTILGFKALAEGFADTAAKLVVWQNEFWGQINAEGKTFKEMKVYKEFGKAVHAIVTIPELKKSTFAVDMSEMLTAKLTFDEAIDGDKFEVMAKHRLSKVKKELFDNIAKVI